MQPKLSWPQFHHGQPSKMSRFRWNLPASVALLKLGNSPRANRVLTTLTSTNSHALLGAFFAFVSSSLTPGGGTCYPWGEISVTRGVHHLLTSNLQNREEVRTPVAGTRSCRAAGPLHIVKYTGKNSEWSRQSTCVRTASDHGRVHV